MAHSAPVDQTPAVPESAGRMLPWWVRILDIAGTILILVAVSVVVTGGFREWTPIGQISITSWMRPLAGGIVAVVARHWLYPRPALPVLVVLVVRRWLSTIEARAIVPVFLSTRLGVFAVGFLAISLVGYATNPPWRVYRNELANLPARWDAGWYLSVAIEGYSWYPPWRDRQQNIAFFPAFPMLMRYAGLLVARQTMWAGVAISFIAFFFALVYLFRFARSMLDDEAAAAGVALLAAYPFALFFSAPYSESLFLLAAVAACYHFERGELGSTALWGLLAGLTRPNGCLLSVVLGLIAIRPLYRTGLKAAPWRVMSARLAAASLPGVGMLIYSTYIYFLTGYPLQWARQNAAWGRVYKGLDTLASQHLAFIEQHGFYDYASNRSLDLLQGLAVLLVLASVWPVFRRFGLPYAVMVLMNVLLPLTMGGLLSIGRVTSVIFPTFLWLGAAVPAGHRPAWLVVFSMLQALCAIVFFTWRPLY